MMSEGAVQNRVPIVIQPYISDIPSASPFLPKPVRYEQPGGSPIYNIQPDQVPRKVPDNILIQQASNGSSPTIDVSKATTLSFNQTSNLSTSTSDPRYSVVLATVNGVTKALMVPVATSYISQQTPSDRNQTGSLDLQKAEQDQDTIRHLSSETVPIIPRPDERISAPKVIENPTQHSMMPALPPKPSRSILKSSNAVAVSSTPEQAKSFRHKTITQNQSSQCITQLESQASSGKVDNYGTLVTSPCQNPSNTQTFTASNPFSIDFTQVQVIQPIDSASFSNTSAGAGTRMQCDTFDPTTTTDGDIVSARNVQSVVAPYDTHNQFTTCTNDTYIPWLTEGSQVLNALIGPNVAQSRESGFVPPVVLNPANLAAPNLSLSLSVDQVNSLRYNNGLPCVTTRLSEKNVNQQNMFVESLQTSDTHGEAGDSVSQSVDEVYSSDCENPRIMTKHYLGTSETIENNRSEVNMESENISLNEEERFPSMTIGTEACIDSLSSDDSVKVHVIQPIKIEETMSNANDYYNQACETYCEINEVNEISDPNTENMEGEANLELGLKIDCVYSLAEEDSNFPTAIAPQCSTFDSKRFEDEFNIGIGKTSPGYGTFTENPNKPTDLNVITRAPTSYDIIRKLLTEDDDSMKRQPVKEEHNQNRDCELNLKESVQRRIGREEPLDDVFEELIPFITLPSVSSKDGKSGRGKVAFNGKQRNRVARKHCTQVPKNLQWRNLSRMPIRRCSVLTPKLSLDDIDKKPHDYVERDSCTCGLKWSKLKINQMAAVVAMDHTYTRKGRGLVDYWYDSDASTDTSPGSPFYYESNEDSAAVSISGQTILTVTPVTPLSILSDPALQNILWRRNAVDEKSVLNKPMDLKKDTMVSLTKRECCPDQVIPERCSAGDHSETKIIPRANINACVYKEAKKRGRKKGTLNRKTLRMLKGAKKRSFKKKHHTCSKHSIGIVTDNQVSQPMNQVQHIERAMKHPESTRGKDAISERIKQEKTDLRANLEMQHSGWQGGKERHCSREYQVKNNIADADDGDCDVKRKSLIFKMRKLENKLGWTVCKDVCPSEGGETGSKSMTLAESKGEAPSSIRNSPYSDMQNSVNSHDTVKVCIVDTEAVKTAKKFMKSRCKKKASRKETVIKIEKSDGAKQVCLFKEDEPSVHILPVHVEPNPDSKNSEGKLQMIYVPSDLTRLPELSGDVESQDPSLVRSLNEILPLISSKDNCEGKPPDPSACNAVNNEISHIIDKPALQEIPPLERETSNSSLPADVGLKTGCPENDKPLQPSNSREDVETKNPGNTVPEKPLSRIEQLKAKLRKQEEALNIVRQRREESKKILKDIDMI